MSTAIRSRNIINGVNTVALNELVDGVAADARNGEVKFAVTTNWTGGAKSETRVEGYEIAGKHIPKDFSILADEPRELCGTNTQPNPQELLLAAFNSCMVVGYVAGATLHGVELESLSIETDGQLDLRGVLDLDSKVKPGYDIIHYVVRIKGDGTPEQFRQIHETVMATSPNRWSIANPIKLTSELVVE